ncbi:hypothetical protein [Allohahella marinimesophila]|uniref:Uncharacterized protein n=1 Tax=Allohahella marinimesophila TaxID=1054972 RepID=A0ABP7NLK9_9GAMM
MSVINGQGPTRLRPDQYPNNAAPRHNQNPDAASGRDEQADVLRSGASSRPSVVTDIGNASVRSAQADQAVYRIEPYAASQAFLELNKLRQMRDDGSSGIVTVEQGPLRRQRDLDELPLRSQAALTMYSAVESSDLGRRHPDAESTALLGVDLFI